MSADEEEYTPSWGEAGPYGPDEPGSIDIGHGVWIRYFTETATGDTHAGLIICHWHPGHQPGDWPCAGTVPFDRGQGGDRPRWALVSEEPLTLTPSIRSSDSNGECLHGYITNGEWVPA